MDLHSMALDWLLGAVGCASAQGSGIMMSLRVMLRCLSAHHTHSG
jgi:hypothetical protein